MVDGADYFLLCHDDVALFPDAVHLMVEEAFRSNAGIVSPKVVSWDDPERLVHVGMTVDKGGSVVERVQPNEIDHGQHDAVRDVFVAPGGSTLVRADLFEELGGFDPAIVAMGEDLDLCWRAQVVGARIIVAPDARVRHLEELAGGARRLDPSLAAVGARTGRRRPPGDPPGAPAPTRAPGRVQVLRAVPPDPGGAPGLRPGPGRGDRGRAGRQPGPGPGGACGPGGGTSGASAVIRPSARSSRPTAGSATRRSGCSRWGERPTVRLRPPGLPARVPRCPRRRAGRGRRAWPTATPAADDPTAPPSAPPAPVEVAPAPVEPGTGRVSVQVRLTTWLVAAADGRHRDPRGARRAAARRRPVRPLPQLVVDLRPVRHRMASRRAWGPPRRPPRPWPWPAWWAPSCSGPWA